MNCDIVTNALGSDLFIPGKTYRIDKIIRGLVTKKVIKSWEVNTHKTSGILRSAGWLHNGKRGVTSAWTKPEPKRRDPKPEPTITPKLEAALSVEHELRDIKRMLKIICMELGVKVDAA